ncbi:MAG: acyltransferase family protein [Leptospiraceae bacterium]|nr:acyltransferase family protein [Leptospiraceae bacterium]
MRLHYLDNLKSIALILGLFFHVAITYADGVGYTVKSEELSFLYTVFVHFIHVFRMPVFFFLSGYFTALTLEKKGEIFFLRSRFSRIVVPALLGISLFAPVESYLQFVQRVGEFSYINFFPYFFTGEFFLLSHLWFLYYLLLFSIIYLIIKSANLNRIAIQDSIPSLLETKLFFKVESVPYTLWTFVTLFLVNLLFTKEDSFLSLSPFHFFYYSVFFIVGTRIYTKRILDLILPKYNELLHRSLWAAFSFGVYLYLEEIDPYWMGIRFEPIPILYRIIHIFLESSLAWNLIIITCSLAKNYLQFQNKFTSFFSESGMCIYLIHHPISLLLGFMFLQIELNMHLKSLVQLFLVITLSYLFYIIISKFKITRMVFGMKITKDEELITKKILST